jgi:hypothetical protein
MIVLPAALIYVIEQEHFLGVLLSDFWDLAVVLATMAAFVFVYLRVMIEIVRSALGRTYQLLLPGTGHRSFVRYYPALFVIIVIAIVLWVFVCTQLNASAEDGPRIITDINPDVVFMVVLSSVMLLLLGLFIAHRKVPELPAFLFALLCLLYSFHGLTIFTTEGMLAGLFQSGVVNVGVIAGLFIVPMQIHFALVFPYEEQTIASDRPFWWRIIPVLYGFFVLFTPLWFLLVYPDKLEQLIQSLPIAIIPMTLGGILVFSSLPLSWIMSGYILWHTQRTLKRQIIDYQPPLSAESTGCQWLDRIAGHWPRDDQERQKIKRQAIRQLHVVFVGGIVSAVLFVLWFMIVPWVPLQGWGIAALQSGFAFVLAASVFAAILMFHLWGIYPYIIAAVLFLFIPQFGLLLGLEYLENLLAGMIGGIAALLIFSLLKVERIFSRLIAGLGRQMYVWFNQQPPWSETLNKVTDQLRDATYRNNDTFLTDTLKQALPHYASAGWILTTANNAGTGDYHIQGICPTGHCKAECLQRLKHSLGQDNTAETITLRPDLYDFLKENVNKPILVNNEQALRNLQEVQLVILVPFGTPQTVQGVYVVATDGRGDYYQQNDIDALTRLADALSYSYPC